MNALTQIRAVLDEGDEDRVKRVRSYERSHKKRLRAGVTQRSLTLRAASLTRDVRRLRERRASWRLTVSPISQSIGGHSPTNSARRSAFPRSSSPIVFARIHSPTQRTTEPSDVLYSRRQTVSGLPLASRTTPFIMRS